jgi:hypothetical protein
MMIHESFQRHLNATAPMAGHHRYSPALPFQQNAFGVLAGEDDSDKEAVNTVATEVTALTYQTQMVTSMVANSNQQHALIMAKIEANQNSTHGLLHQTILQINVVTFNVDNAGYGCVYYGPGCSCGRAGDRAVAL